MRSNTAFQKSGSPSCRPLTPHVDKQSGPIEHSKVVISSGSQGDFPDELVRYWLTLAGWLAIGIALGVGIGSALDNVALGIAIGAIVGAGIGMAVGRKRGN